MIQQKFFVPCPGQCPFNYDIKLPEGILAGDSDVFATLFVLSVPLHPKDPYRFRPQLRVLKNSP